MRRRPDALNLERRPFERPAFDWRAGARRCRSNTPIDVPRQSQGHTQPGSAA